MLPGVLQCGGEVVEGVSARDVVDKERSGPDAQCKEDTNWRGKVRGIEVAHKYATTTKANNTKNQKTTMAI